MRHTGAGLAIPDFPLAFGRLWPPLHSPAIAIHFAHRLGALAVTLGVIWTVLRIVRQYRAERYLLRPALSLLGLLVIQLSLGAVTIWSQRAVIPVTAHVAVGASVLATSVLVTLRAWRLVMLPARISGDIPLSEQVMA
jgi:cytochrome c oxidase assembly protein subunit 15